MPNVPFERELAATHTADLLAWFFGLSPETAGRVTDANVGSNLRTFFEAIALRLEALDNKVFFGLRRLIPTILFEFLGDGDGVSTTTGFPALPALAATGVARFTRQVGGSGDVVIPAGTRLQVPGVGTAAPKTYVTTTPLTLLDGVSLGDTTVAAAAVGTVGNTPANTMVLLDPVAGIASATNPVALLSGRDAETDEDRRLRWVQYIRNLARAQDGGLEAGALRAVVVTGGAITERVLAARAVPVAGKRGLVDVYIDNGGGSASSTLVQAAQVLIDGVRAADGSRVPGYKAAGVVAQVQPVVPQAVPVTLTLRVADGFRFADVQPAVATAILSHLFGLGVFADLVWVDLVAAIATVAGVGDFTLATPLANVAAGLGGRILPGPVTITEAAA